jgi:Tfp pilus assembly protein PilW
MISLVKGFKRNCSSMHGVEADHMRANSYNAGLTLVELIVVMVLSLVLVGSAFMAHLAHSKTGKEQHEVASLQQDIRAIMDMIDRDVRNSGCMNPKFASFSAVTATSSGVNMLGLNMDMNLDGDTSDAGEKVIYSLAGTTLPSAPQNCNPLYRCSVQRSDQGVTTTMVENVTTFKIDYFDVNNNPIVPAGKLTQTQANNVLSMQVTLGLQSADIDPDTGQTIKRLESRRVQSRNLEIIQKGM